ncbi:hypothetical protein [Halomonas sp. NO4]|uniref:hypothetical protein n=1 Tax=Halomonas sp. NO4 TaxID=2484813 RepID=UPI0013D1CF51|nr:hypothetical protein [Halomonas sp. NO4]
MDTENIEAFLARLIEVNESISDQLTDIKSDINEIRSELNWAEDLSFSKQIYEALNSIDSHLGSIEGDISSLGD